MIPIVDTAAMREADRVTISELGLPGLVLMELAAAAVTDLVTERFADAGQVLIVCGPGNNGGDGLAVARQLRNRGHLAEAVLLADPSQLRGDAAMQLALARSFGVPVHECVKGPLDELARLLADARLVVDALFGTGLERALDGRWQTAVELIDGAGWPVVAVDIPSGLSGSASDVPGPAVRATVTVTFGAPKLAHVLPPACERCGEVAVADIGIPPWILERQAVAAMLEADDVAAWLPVRERDAHKGHFGHLLVIAGRVGRAGAAALAARAAVNAGCGLVTVATAEGAVTPVQAAVPEAMVDPLPQAGDGAVTGDGVESLLAKATAVAIGPGLGLGDGPRRLLERVLGAWHGPLLLDADALTLLDGRLERLAGRAGETVVTPHPGELGRLLGLPTAVVAADRLGAAGTAAARSGATVLAKGARTVIVHAADRPLINPTGGPGLASGGAGDVLTGVVGALLAQGLAGRQACAVGAWLHGRAAELAASAWPGAVPASVVAAHLPGAEAELREPA
jgi:NAD(P)H-hydrate epimerase